MANNGQGRGARPIESIDAVVVVPGIMGSELRVGGKCLWGFKSLRWYFESWKTSKFAELRLTEAECQGQYSRVEATALISSPAFLPRLDSVNPYTAIVARLERESIHAAAVAQFPYDWRLPVIHNGAILAKRASEHFRDWVNHPTLREYQRLHPGRRPKLVILAHSMGGLVAKHAADVCDTPIDRIVSLGTPWAGSVRALSAVYSGKLPGLPLSTSGVRDLVRNMPGIHDLLPMYECVAPAGPSVREYSGRPDPASEPSFLTAGMVSAMGGQGELFSAAKTAYQLRKHPGPEIRATVGVGQKTLATVHAIDSDNVLFDDRSYEWTGTGYIRDIDHKLELRSLTGDGTVVSYSAKSPNGSDPSVQGLKHGQLASAEEGILAAVHLVIQEGRGPQLLGDDHRSVGLDVDELVPFGQPARAHITGITSGRDCQLMVRTQYGALTEGPAVTLQDGKWGADLPTDLEGIFTVEADPGGGKTPVQARYLCIRE